MRDPSEGGRHRRVTLEGDLAVRLHQHVQQVAAREGERLASEADLVALAAEQWCADGRPLDPIGNHLLHLSVAKVWSERVPRPGGP